MKDKSIFDVQALDINSFAHSLGLAVSPRIRFLQRLNKTKRESRNRSSDRDNNNENEIDDEDSINERTASLSYQNDKTNDHIRFQTNDDEDDSDDDILKVKRMDHDISLPTETENLELNAPRNKNKKPISKASLAKKIIKKKIVPNKKILFTEDGEAISDGFKEKKSELAVQYEQENSPGINIEMAKKVLKEEDRFDKQLFKAKVKAKHKEARRKLKEKKKAENEFSESESGEEPDLSWLPDPDKVYGAKNEETDDSNLKSDADVKLNSKKRKRYGLSYLNVCLV